MKKIFFSSVRFRSVSRLFALLVAMCWAIQGVCADDTFTDETVWYPAFEVDGIYYAFTSSQEVWVCCNRQADGSFSRYSGVVHIPEEIEYKGDDTHQSGVYRVTGISTDAFTKCSDLTEVSIPSSIIYIYGESFQNCSSLEKIVVKEGNLYYDSREDCNAIIRVDGVLVVGCKKTHIPNGVTSIADGAFTGCSGLTELNIPSSVTKIGYKAFNGCAGLERIVVDSNNSYYDSREGCNAIICTDKNELQLGCKNTSIPNSVTKISDYAFYGCMGLTELTIPSSVVSIGDCVFWDCPSLVSITSLNPTPPRITQGTFWTKIATLHVPTGCKTAYENADFWWWYFDNIQDDATDGIESIIAAKQGKTDIYTLDGKRLNAANAADLPKGVYIINGKKHVVK